MNAFHLSTYLLVTILAARLSHVSSYRRSFGPEDVPLADATTANAVSGESTGEQAAREEKAEVPPFAEGVTKKQSDNEVGEEEASDASKPKHEPAAETVKRACMFQKLCIATSNQPQSHNPESNKFQDLFEACVRADPGVETVALALQDFSGLRVPMDVQVPGMVAGTHFQFRHELRLDARSGAGHLCYSRMAGGGLVGALMGGALGALVVATAGHSLGLQLLGMGFGAVFGGFRGHDIASAIGVNCGCPAALLYELSADYTQPETRKAETIRILKSGETATTRKGTVAMRLSINGREIVLASTHGVEGIRGKHQEAPCSGEAPTGELQAERKRVQGFRDALDALDELRATNVSGGVRAFEAAVLWGGDFNPRTADPQTGCPIWPERFLRGTNEKTLQTALENLTRGRDVLGEDPSRPNVITSFSYELAERRYREVAAVKCPTYKKIPNFGEGDELAPEFETKMFQCDEGDKRLFYKSTHPPSWTDRIFTSSDRRWLDCAGAQRVTHDRDHDALVVVCSIASQGCDVADGET